MHLDLASMCVCARARMSWHVGYVYLFVSDPSFQWCFSDMLQLKVWISTTECIHMIVRYHVVAGSMPGTTHHFVVLCLCSIQIWLQDSQKNLRVRCTTLNIDSAYYLVWWGPCGFRSREKKVAPVSPVGWFEVLPVSRTERIGEAQKLANTLYTPAKSPGNSNTNPRA